MKQLVSYILVTFQLFLVQNQIFSQKTVEDKFRQTIYKTDAEIKTGATRFANYLPLLQGKRVAIIANQTSVVNKTHLVDTLLSLKVNIVKVFGPEHGFRGNASAGKSVGNEKDSKTGLSVISLYGANKKPTAEQLANVDVLVFDVQDVGARFYTYISTMTYAMEACAAYGKKMIVLDRPNPNGHFVDGPVLKKGFEGFVGLHPVPIAHGMTVGEYAQMLNGEMWLSGGKKCDLTVITCTGYSHKDYYKLPVNPSPNIQTMEAVYLYPTLCLFEGTVMSVGRGTDKPFQVIGHPQWKNANYTFTPQSIPGVSDKPKYAGQLCHGYNLTDFSLFYIKDTGQIYLFWLIDAYKRMKENGEFFTDYFDKLAGSSDLRNQIIKGVSEDDIKKSWVADLETFKKIRAKYLLYEDFQKK